MTIGASTVWRVRVGGNASNGAGYDSTISGAGTDYSQQDSPQLSLTDLVCSGDTTVTSVTGGFTTAMIGNAMKMSGGGATEGYYFVITCTDTNTITVDRTPGTVVAGTGKVGGAADKWQTVANNANGAGFKCVAGNIIYIRGSGSELPSSDDYTTTGFVTPPNGDETDGFVKFIGENGRPRMSSNGLQWYDANHVWFENLYVATTGNSNGDLGIIHTSYHSVIKNCVVNTGNYSGLAGINVSYSCGIFGNLIFSHTSIPSFSADAFGIRCRSYGCRVVGNTIRFCRDSGIVTSLSTQAGGFFKLNRVYSNAGDGISAQTDDAVGICIEQNVIDGNLGHGITFPSLIDIAYAAIFNNIISNHVQSGKKGLNIVNGSTALNDAIKTFVDYNAYYNNTAHFGNISAGANDVIDEDPDYVDAANGDFTPQNILLKAGYAPHGGEVWIGAIQPDESAGGMLRPISSGGGLV